MMVSSAHFSPSMLNNVQELKTLFTGKEEIQMLANLPKEAFVHPKDQLYMSRWRVGWILVTSPFRRILCYFLKVISTFLECFSRNLSRRVYLSAHHLYYPFDQAKNQLHYGKRFLSPALNDYRKDCSDVYTQKNFPRKDILEPIIQEKLHSKFYEVAFDLFGKLCCGSTYWFNFLFLKGMQDPKIKAKYPSIIDYARTLAKNFAEGQPRQSALLQSLYGLQLDLLPEIQEEPYHLKPFAQENLSDFEDGVYHLALPKHSISYIKFGNEEMIMDPAEGLILIEKPEDLWEIILKYTEGEGYKNEPVFFALQSLAKEQVNIPRIFGTLSA